METTKYNNTLPKKPKINIIQRGMTLKYFQLKPRTDRNISYDYYYPCRF